MIMAGGKGSRLGPLTSHRAKPSVPFAGRYRIIDFVLSNFVNSGYRRLYVLTQYMASSLIKHLNRNWHLGGVSQYVEVVPAQMRMGEHWYRGTADSIYQNLNLIRDSRAVNFAVFGGDHIYKFAIDQMEEAHIELDADLTVAAFPVPKSEAHHFGVIQIDEAGRIVGFQEKPRENAQTIPGRPEWCLVSMGNYFFKTDTLIDVLIEDANDPHSAHDFGKNVIPGEPKGAAPYWRDVGTIESYFQANMEVRSRLPAINLYNRQWRIRTAQRDYPPARFVRAGDEPSADIDDSLVCEGSIVASAMLRRVVLGYDSYVHSRAEVEDSVILSGCNIGARARLRRVLLDKNCSIAPGAEIGVDPEADRRRFPFITESGIVVLPKGTHVPASGPLEIVHDMDFLMRNDPATQQALGAFDGLYTISKRERHSFESSGPRYTKYSGNKP
ncbi:MAG: glucose-1-phosphate adenylyltransferase [Myxococcales bacterium]|nr:glucose-1-phosphate adenylyltransferase [Myxococcales bacterium]